MKFKPEQAEMKRKVFREARGDTIVDDSVCIYGSQTEMRKQKDDIISVRRFVFSIYFYFFQPNIALENGNDPGHCVIATNYSKFQNITSTSVYKNCSFE